jgi:hypothetical protein
MIISGSQDASKEASTSPTKGAPSRIKVVRTSTESKGLSKNWKYLKLRYPNDAWRSRLENQASNKRSRHFGISLKKGFAL